MQAEQRWRAITRWLEETGRLDVLETARWLAVAPETIRRDLRRLESADRLQRVHGGAVRVETATPVLPPTQCWPPGAIVAEEAWACGLWNRLRGAGSIVLGGGPMVLALARAIVADPPPTDGGPTLISSSLDATLLLAPVGGLTVFHLGGAVAACGAGEGYPVAGDWGLVELARVEADVSVVGPAGLSQERGLSEPGTAAAALCRAQLRAGRRVVALGSDRSLGSGALVTVAGLDQVDELVFASDPIPEAARPLLAGLRGGPSRSRSAPEFL